MLNKKGVVSFILSLVLIFSLCSICSAVEMGMDKDKAADELQKNRPKNCQRIIDLGNMIEVEYNNSDHFLDRYYYNLHLNNKITHVVKYYSNNYHDQLLPSLIKAYGKPLADYYTNFEKKYLKEEISSMSEKDKNKFIKKNELERRVVWNTKREYIILLIHDNMTYIMRFWKQAYNAFPIESTSGLNLMNFVTNG